jgi:hypothetical protein
MNAGAGLDAANIFRVADLLGLSIVPTKPRQKGKR